MNARTTLQADTGDREITLTRDFDHPRERVFHAWTDSGALAAWFGPHGFATEILENDVRPGGRYHYVMRDKDGVDYPVRGRFDEIVPPERLVMTGDLGCMPDDWLAEHAAEEIAAGVELLETAILTLHDLGGGRTRMTLVTRTPSNRLRDGLVATGMAQGWGESFEKMDALLGSPR